MNIFKSVIDGLGGGLVNTIVDTAKEYFPPSMSEKDSKEFDLKLRQVTANVEVKLQTILSDIQRMFEDRIRDMEGTASDLKSVKFFGPLIIFFRGLQRPLWGFATMWMDYNVFAGEWIIEEGSKQDLAFLIINFLVLGFLFGERALKNLMPLIERLLKK